MECVAAFVYANGGVATAQELQSFFSRCPDVRTAVLAEVYPTTALKKIVARVGHAHGLSWCDADPQSHKRGSVVVHEMTDAQMQRGAFTNEVQWVPHSLDTLECFVQALPIQMMRPGGIAAFYKAHPLETAFMKRRCGGVVEFVQQYDPDRRRMFVDECRSVHLTDCTVSAELYDPAVDSDVNTVQTIDRANVCCMRSSTALEPVQEPDDVRDVKCAPVSPDAFLSLFTRKSMVVLMSVSDATVALRAATLVARASADTTTTSGARSRQVMTSPLPPRAQRARAVLDTSPLLLSAATSPLALERALRVLCATRASPVRQLHPLAFAIICFERHQQTRAARKTMQRSIAAAATALRVTQSTETLDHESTHAAPASCLMDEAELLDAPPTDVASESLVVANQVDDHDATSATVLAIAPGVSIGACDTSAWLLLLGDRDSALEVATPVLARITCVLLSVRAPPRLHPLASLILRSFAQHAQKQQRRRAIRANAKRQHAPASLGRFGAFYFVIPKATLTMLSCCASTLDAAAPTLDVDVV